MSRAGHELTRGTLWEIINLPWSGLNSPTEKPAFPESRGAVIGRFMAHWLMKSEPSSYGWDDLVRDGGTEWDGVRNPTARINLRAMKVGDEAFFYHSMDERQIVGIMRIVREAQPDEKDANWVSVRVEPVRPISPVTLKAIKAEPKLAQMELLRQSRLSVAPVRDDEWKLVLAMAEQN